MSAIRKARKGKRVATSRRVLQHALAAHQPGVNGPEDSAMTETSSALTFIDTPNKATEVFAITELLEEILLQLPRKDTLMCQRVNRIWSATVVGSVKLQRYLYLAAERDIGVVALMASTAPSKDLVLSKYVLHDSPEASNNETHCQLVVPHPLLFFNTDLHNRGSSVRSPNSSYADLLAHGQLPFHNINLLVGLFTGALSFSSCLEMFLTQPPVCEIAIELNILNCNECEGKTSCCFALSDVRNPKGLRVKDVFAAMRSFHYKRRLPRGEEEEDITSISISFRAVTHGSRKGVLLLDAEDMRRAKAEAEAFKAISKTSVVEKSARDEG